MNFYEVKFRESDSGKIVSHYVYTNDMEQAKRSIERDEPYVEILNWKRINERDLPDFVVVIQKCFIQ